MGELLNLQGDCPQSATGSPCPALVAERAERQATENRVLARLTVQDEAISQLQATINGARNTLAALLALAIPAAAQAVPQLLHALIDALK